VARSRLEALAHAAGRTVGSKWRRLREMRAVALPEKAKDEPPSGQRLIEEARARAQARAEARARGTTGAARRPGSVVASPPLLDPAVPTSAELQSAQAQRVLDELRAMHATAAQLPIGKPSSPPCKPTPAESASDLEAAVHALVNGGPSSRAQSPEGFDQSAQMRDARSLVSEPDATSRADLWVPVLIDGEAPTRMPSAPTATLTDKVLPVKVAQASAVGPPDTGARQPVELVSATPNEGLATLPSSPEDVAARTFLIPAPPTGLIPRWFGPGETVVVAGLVLPGMVWVGGRHSAGTDARDPSMIDPALPVDRSSSVCTLLSENGLDYATLAPPDRGAYLNWLVNGRRSPVPAGLAMLFFKGLERRTLDVLSKLGAGDELGCLAAEMQALAMAYGPLSRSLQEHASDLSTVVEFGLTQARAYAAPSGSGQPTLSPSLEIRLAVAQAAFDRAPLPADWALKWVLQDAHITVRTGALLCLPELQRLFRVRYQERYGAGIELPRTGGPLVLTYSPVSPATTRGKPLTVATTSTAEVPDFHPVRGELRKLVESCLEELSAFSRVAGRSPGGARTIDGLVRLPTAAWPDDATDWFKGLEVEVRKAPKLLAIDAFRLRFGGQSTVTRDTLAALYKVLGSFGVGVEPRELASSSVISTAERVALFSDSGPGHEARESEDFTDCNSLVDLSIALAASGGEMTSEDKQLIAAEVKSRRRLKAGQAARLLARLDVVKVSSIDFKAALRQLNTRDEDTRLEAMNFLVRLAYRDIDSTRVRSATLNQFRTALLPGLKATAPIAVPAPRAPPQRKVDPPPKPRPVPPKATPKRLKLDPVRIATVQLETAKTEKLLHGLFTGDDGPEHTKPIEPVATVATFAPKGLRLDVLHTQLLGQLLARDSWVLEDLRALMAQHDLMLNGAIEALNEAVFDAFGMGLFEGDDPLEVDADVRRLILQAAQDASAPAPE